MLNLKFIQENKETVIERLAVKNFDARESVEKIIALDNQRKSLQQEAEAKQAQMNIIAKEIGKLMQSGQKEAAEKARCGQAPCPHRRTRRPRLCAWQAL